MEKRIKATKIEVVPSQHQPTKIEAVPSQHQPTSSNNSSAPNVFGTLFGIGIFALVIAFNFFGDDGGSTRSNPNSNDQSSYEEDLDSAMEKGRSGRGMEMTNREADAFRRKQEADSYSHKQEILNGLTRGEKELRDYEDAAILRGETKSNAHYEELQRKASDSRR